MHPELPVDEEKAENPQDVHPAHVLVALEEARDVHPSVLLVGQALLALGHVQEPVGSDELGDLAQQVDVLADRAGHLLELWVVGDELLDVGDAVYAPLVGRHLVLVGGDQRPDDLANFTEVLVHVGLEELVIVGRYCYLFSCDKNNRKKRRGSLSCTIT